MSVFNSRAVGPDTSKDQPEKTVPVLDHFRSHPRTSGSQQEGGGGGVGEYDAYTLPHPVWSEEEVHSVQISPHTS